MNAEAKNSSSENTESYFKLHLNVLRNIFKDCQSFSDKNVYGKVFKMYPQLQCLCHYA